MFLGKPEVSSEDFDIKLMIYLLQPLASIKVGNLDPVYPYTSIETMLSRIKYVMNEISKSFEGKLPNDQFNQYWDYIGQVRIFLLSQYRCIFYLNSSILNTTRTHELFFLRSGRHIRWIVCQKSNKTRILKI